MASSSADHDHEAEQRSNRLEMSDMTANGKSAYPPESARTNAVRNSGDSDLRRTTVVADTRVLKTDGGSSELPVMPLQDQETMDVFIFLKIVTLVSAIYMSASTWAFFYEPDTGAICPYRVICATTWPEKILLTFSRLSAGALFSAVTITVLSKCYSTKAFLHHSWFGAIIDIEPSHDMHTYFGYLMLVAGVEHGVLHIIRYSIGGDADLLYKTNVGRSGVICMLLLFPIVLPMKFQWFKDKMRFETRKGMHMLFIPLIVGLCFHSTAFCYVSAILIAWYAADRFYFTTKQTFLIQHPTFEAVGRGTMVGLELPPGYDFKAGSYIYVNCPAISLGEWHPFSIIPVPGASNTAAFYAEVVGDWTRALFRLGLDQPRLPLWITTAQPSTMDKTVYYDRVVLICTGAGITPGISIAQRYAKNKNIHLLWITRDAGMVALFEKQLRLVSSTVYLTGKPDTEVKLALSKLLAPAASTMAVNGLVSTGSNSSALGLVRNESSDSARRLDDCFREIRGSDRPASILEMTRASLLSGDAELVESPRGPPPVLAALHPVEEAHEPKSKRSFTQVSTRALHPISDVSSSAPPGSSPTPSRRAPGALPGPTASHNRSSSMPKSLGGGGRSGSEKWASAGRATEELPHHGHRKAAKHNVASMSVDSYTDDVELVFGRPDIKEYLQGIFSGKQKGADNDVERPAQARTGGTRHTRDPSDRLDGHQLRSKAILLAADKNMLQLSKAHGGSTGYSAKASRALPSASVSDSTSRDNHCSSMGRSDPPLVLYCGANPKVEEVIEATCSENCVPWKKEYFGAW